MLKDVINCLQEEVSKRLLTSLLHQWDRNLYHGVEHSVKDNYGKQLVVSTLIDYKVEIYNDSRGRLTTIIAKNSLYLSHKGLDIYNILDRVDHISIDILPTGIKIIIDELIYRNNE